MDEMYVRLHRIYSLVRDVLAEPSITYNPIGVRLRTVLEEEELVLAKALQVARQKPSDLQTLREFISIIYRSDEVAQPTVRAWARASVWMRTGTRHELQTVLKLFRQIFRELKRLVPILDQIYGETNVRYIVPFEYRRRLTKRGA